MIQAFRKVVDLHDNDGDDVREEEEVEKRCNQARTNQDSTDYY